MTPVDARTLTIAISPGPWFWIRNLDCSRDELISHLGTPQWTESEEGMVYDFHNWVLRASCGLKIWYSVPEDGPPISGVCASLPEVDHFLRHDPWARTKTLPRDDEHIESDHNSLIEYHKHVVPTLAQLKDFQVWRMGDDGNEVKIGFPTSEIDAECMVAEFESHKHKQTYWVSRCVRAPT